MRRNAIRRCRPPETAITGWYAGADLLDAYCLALPDGAPRDARTLARMALSDPPWVFRHLMTLRDRLVAPLGIRSSDDIRAGAAGDTRIDFFPVQSETADEVVVGEDDRHLDFRTSLAVVREESRRCLSARRRCAATTGRGGSTWRSSARSTSLWCRLACAGSSSGSGKGATYMPFEVTLFSGRAFRPSAGSIVPWSKRRVEGLIRVCVVSCSQRTNMNRAVLESPASTPCRSSPAKMG